MKYGFLLIFFYLNFTENTIYFLKCAAYYILNIPHFNTNSTFNIFRIFVGHSCDDMLLIIYHIKYIIITVIVNFKYMFYTI